MRIGAVILAAGQGTRMRSNLPKVLHPLLGKPMLKYVLDAACQVTGAQPVVVVGHGGDEVRRVFQSQAQFVVQEPQLGTGHAVQQAEALLRDQLDLVLVTYGDMPLLTVETLQRVVDAQMAHGGPMTMLTLLADDPRGFGRVVRTASGQVTAIVEEAQATVEQQAIRELNASVYCFAADWLWQALERIQLSPKGEYYLTDLVGIATAEGGFVQALVLDEANQGIGINTRVHLAEAEAILRRRVNQRWMLAGVTMIDPQSTYIEPDVTIGADTMIWPNTILRGSTVIGSGCELGPNSVISNSQVGDHCKVFASVVECAQLDNHVDIGPFARLRKGAHLGDGVHMGNFGEVKNSYLGANSKMGHFSYIGDATIGERVNIGAGTVTCNFDGEKKSATEIGADAFIGSDTMLVAPVTIGAGAHTGAGAVVTKNVPDDTLAVGVPARVIRKLKKRD
jgi:bifunctional UDP-N-acetylglucosamine pyrophosphorylase / glucosamine-1-phosphate N-acetyltransferase